MEDEKETTTVSENENKNNELPEDTVEENIPVDVLQSAESLDVKDDAKEKCSNVESEDINDQIKTDPEELINSSVELEVKNTVDLQTETNTKSEKQSKNDKEQCQVDSATCSSSKDPLNEDTDNVEETDNGSKSPKQESTDDIESHTEPQITTESIPVNNADTAEDNEKSLNEDSSMNDVEMEDLELKESVSTETAENETKLEKEPVETPDEPMDVDETDKASPTESADFLFNSLKNTPDISHSKSLIESPTVEIPESDKSLKESDTSDSFNDTTDNITNDISDDKIADNLETQDEAGDEERVCDIEEGKGVDEEICLLPDSEIEITDADKERAILAKEAAQKSEQNKSTDENSSGQAVIEQTPSNSDSIEMDEENITEGIETPSETADQDCADEQINTPKENEIFELVGDSKEIECIECKEKKLCEFSVMENEETNYICDMKCVESLQTKNTDKYTLTMKKIIINLILDSMQKCSHCNEDKACKFRFKENGTEYKYLCSDTCLNDYIGVKKLKYLVKRKRYLIEDSKITDTEYACLHCAEKKICKYLCKQDEELYICDDNCYNLLIKEQPGRFRTTKQLVRVRDLPLRSASSPQTVQESDITKMIARSDEDALIAQRNREESFIRKCVQCYSEIAVSDKSLYWETQDYCNEVCLGQYQHDIGSVCTTCRKNVSLASLGKYCVRFGYDIKQFCRSLCLDQYKKGLKVCSFCQNDISKNKNGFLAPVGDKGQFKDFCSQKCLKDYEELSCAKKRGVISVCAVCNNKKVTKLEVVLDDRSHRFCSNPCFSAFKFVNNVFPDQCTMCTKYFERKIGHFTIYEDGKPATLFCSKICMNVFIITYRQIVPCNWCKVKKYNFDMIQKIAGDISMLFCSLNCLTLCEVSAKALSSVRNPCDQCKLLTKPQYHLTMSDGSVRNFCTYQCVMAFQSQFGKSPLTLDSEDGVAVVPTGLPKRIKKDVIGTAQKITSTTPQLPKTSANVPAIQSIPIITNVQSLAAPLTTITTRNLRKSKQKEIILKKVPSPFQSTRRTVTVLPAAHGSPAQQQANPQFVQPSSPLLPAAPPVSKIEYKTQVITIPATPSSVGNIATMCKPIVESKGVSCRPKMCTVECQTDDYLQRKIVIPIPVPIYVPVPMHMFSMPVPTPVPMPLPIPVPIFIPTTRNSAAGIMKEIKKIQDKMPTDPFEAELLMMAEMVAGEKKKNESDSSDDEAVVEFTTETIESHNAFGEDMLQMALKMATEYEEPAVDLESAMTANTITPSTHPNMPQSDESTDEPTSMHHHHHMMLLEQSRAQPMQRGRKRGASQNSTRGRNSIGNNQSPKRARRSDLPVMQVEPEETREPAEKPDAHLCLKFTFGVNAWKQWVMTKNADLEKSTIRRKPFKSDLLQLTADELNYSLCMFVKEVRKPNGSDYAPDTIYYLVLGIQEFLYENNRIDNIFTDPYYEKFTDCLDEVAKKFSVLYNDSQYIVTRVEEEHLWECKQLGAHSPHVLLSTLMFFNTKHFNLTSVEEHMQLSFSHIMKHWKRNPNQPGATKIPGSRNVLLRFYPPQTSIENSRKKKVYEQQENEENPLRCPVKLYEFYLSKCPESVKTRNDVFYLQPERSCVPDSPVWYSTQALSREALSKMLHRVKMVKEINIALLTS